MRIADKMRYGQVERNLQNNRAEMSQLQNQAATQKRVTKPSDDPLAATRVLEARSEERGNVQFTKSIFYMKNFLEFSDQALGEMTEALNRSKELALGQASDAGASALTRRAVAEEIGQLYSQALQIGNRKLGDRFIFSGYKTQTQPFDKHGEYHGDEGDMKVQLHKKAFVAMNLPGSKVFAGQGLGADGIAHTEETPVTTPELMEYRHELDNKPPEQPAKLEMRSPASVNDILTSGINVFNVMKSLEIALRTNDKEQVQSSLNGLDQALQQVILARAELGSRLSSVNGTLESLQKAIVDNKTLASQLEDAEIFQTVSDINKTDATLKASLETSGKLIQPSLLDFIK